MAAKQTWNLLYCFVDLSPSFCTCKLIHVFFSFLLTLQIWLDYRKSVWLKTCLSFLRCIWYFKQCILKVLYTIRKTKEAINRTIITSSAFVLHLKRALLAFPFLLNDLFLDPELRRTDGCVMWFEWEVKKGWAKWVLHQKKL